MMIPFLIFGSIFFIIGSAMIIGRMRVRRLCTVQTEGVVHDVKRKVSKSDETDDDGRTRQTTRVTYAPVFQYYANGRTITKESCISSGAKPEIGRTVTLFYNPDNVEEYYVPEEKAARYGGFIFLIVGAIFIVAALVS